jgi:hypothetical protein
VLFFLLYAVARRGLGGLGGSNSERALEVGETRWLDRRLGEELVTLRFVEGGAHVLMVRVGREDPHHQAASTSTHGSGRPTRRDDGSPGAMVLLSAGASRPESPTAARDAAARRAMRRLVVVVVDVPTEHPLEMASRGDQRPVETLPAHGSHPSLRHGVCPGRPDQCPDDFHILSREDRVEGSGELRVSVAHQVPNIVEPAIDHLVPGLLRDQLVTGYQTIG